jgi:hypothetical protein
MISAFRSKLTYANVVATLALFVALGGSSYAAITLSKNSVKSKHIAKGAVKRSDIGRSAVNSRKVADGSLLGIDFKPGQLPTGPQGPKGDPGPQGPPGPTVAATGDADDPQAGPDAALALGATSDFTTPTSGDVLAFGQLRLQMSCAAGFNCNFTAGLYLDGAPVPDSGRFETVPQGTTQTYDLDLFGLAEDVPAGTHTVTVGWKSSSPNKAVWASQSRYRTAALLVGG